jgi:hypothetical protein
VGWAVPVADIEVHTKMRKFTHEAGCYEHRDQGRTILCRQIGRMFHGSWVPLSECLGCQARKDHEYITQSRQSITAESRKFMKADKR